MVRKEKSKERNEIAVNVRPGQCHKNQLDKSENRWDTRE